HVADFRQRPAVGEDLTDAGVAFVQHDDDVVGLHDLSWLRVDVELHQPHRQTVRIGVVLRVLLLALLIQLARPRPEGQAILEAGADLRERRLRRLPRWRHGRPSGTALVEPQVLVHAGEVDAAARGAGRRRVEVHLAVGGFWNLRARASRPLCGQWQAGTRQRDNDSYDRPLFHGPYRS